MRRRYHSSIVAIAKDENPYLLEWAAYHLAIGFEHIWLYDNMSRVGLRGLLRSAAARRRITVIDWPDTPGENSQFTAYADFVKRFRSRTEWVAVIDLDELICLKAHRTIGAFLDGFGDATAVGINWRFFGSSGQVEHAPGLLMERFTRAAEIGNAINQGIKSISRTRNLGILSPHYAEHHGGNRPYSSAGAPVANDWTIPTDPDNFAVAQVNHYFVKSRAEWEAKLRRGYTWAEYERANLLALWDRNDCEDRSILRWKPETERWMRILGTSEWDRAKAGLRRLIGR